MKFNVGDMFVVSNFPQTDLIKNNPSYLERIRYNLCYIIKVEHVETNQQEYVSLIWYRWFDGDNNYSNSTVSTNVIDALKDKYWVHYAVR